jgi:hypothetical protein
MIIAFSHIVTVVLPVVPTHLVHDACMFIKCTKEVGYLGSKLLCFCQTFDQTRYEAT